MKKETSPKTKTQFPPTSRRTWEQLSPEEGIEESKSSHQQTSSWLLRSLGTSRSWSDHTPGTRCLVFAFPSWVWCHPSGPHPTRPFRVVLPQQHGVGWRVQSVFLLLVLPWLKLVVPSQPLLPSTWPLGIGLHQSTETWSHMPLVSPTQSPCQHLSVPSLQDVPLKYSHVSSCTSQTLKSPMVRPMVYMLD